MLLIPQVFVLLPCGVVDMRPLQLCRKRFCLYPNLYTFVMYEAFDGVTKFQTDAFVLNPPRITKTRSGTYIY